MRDHPSTSKNTGDLYTLIGAAATAQIAVPALKISIVVGSVLNLINQGGRLIDGDQINWFQVALNYVVPYCVACYSAARNELRNR